MQRCTRFSRTIPTANGMKGNQRSRCTPLLPGQSLPGRCSPARCRCLQTQPASPHPIQPVVVGVATHLPLLRLALLEEGIWAVCS